MASSSPVAALTSITGGAVPPARDRDRDRIEAAARQEFGLTRAEVAQAARSGISAADLLARKGVDRDQQIAALVQWIGDADPEEIETLHQRTLAQVRPEAPAGEIPPGGEQRALVLAEVAQWIGRPYRQLEEAWRGDRSLAEIAEEAGVPENQLALALRMAMPEAPDALIADLIERPAGAGIDLLA